MYGLLVSAGLAVLLAAPSLAQAQTQTQVPITKASNSVPVYIPPKRGAPVGRIGGGFQRPDINLPSLMDWINEYLREMASIVMQYGGVVLRFIGDPNIAGFGVPLPRCSENGIREDAINEPRLCEITHARVWIRAIMSIVDRKPRAIHHC